MYTGISVIFFFLLFFLFSHFCLVFYLPGFSVVRRLLGETMEYEVACPWWERIDGSFFVGKEMCR